MAATISSAFQGAVLMMGTTFVQRKVNKMQNLWSPFQNLLDIYHEPKKVQYEVSILWKITLKKSPIEEDSCHSESIQELF